MNGGGRGHLRNSVLGRRLLTVQCCRLPCHFWKHLWISSEVDPLLFSFYFIFSDYAKFVKKNKNKICNSNLVDIKRYYCAVGNFNIITTIINIIYNVGVLSFSTVSFHFFIPAYYYDTLNKKKKNIFYIVISLFIEHVMWWWCVWGGGRNCIHIRHKIKQ